MTTDQAETPAAVRVHLVADSTRTPAPPTPARRRTVRYLTITLTAAQPVAAVAGTELLRDRIVARASGNDVWITDSQPAAARAATGITGEACAIHAADTGPTSWESTEAIYAAATTYPATLGVMIVQREAP